MIKQDYLVRMIQEIISLLANAILQRRKIEQKNWVEYDDLTQQILGFDTRELASKDAEEIKQLFGNDLNRMGKMELAAVTMLKMGDETENDLVLKTKLRTEGLSLLKYVNANDTIFSLQRIQLIAVLEKDFAHLG